MTSEPLPQSVFIAGLSSDIGRELAIRFTAGGSHVAGTARNCGCAPECVRAIHCDLSSLASIEAASRSYAEIGLKPWELYVSSVGNLDPIGPFFELDSGEWIRSVEANCLRQLELLKRLYPLRKRGMAHVAFFAGAGTNGPAPGYSAYCASKIFLMKMCELLHAENPDLNCFIIGPGIVRTKIHEQTLRAGGRAGANLARMEEFLAGQDRGVSHEEIFACLSWCIQAGREVVGGRNISLVGDSWRGGGESLATALRNNPDAFRLRRHSNDI